MMSNASSTRAGTGHPEVGEQELVCHKCGEVIVGRAMKAGDVCWHESHFTCSDCGIRLKDTKVRILTIVRKVVKNLA